MSVLTFPTFLSFVLFWSDALVAPQRRRTQLGVRVAVYGRTTLFPGWEVRMGVVALFHCSFFIFHLGVCVIVVGEVGCIDVGFNESKEFVCVCVWWRRLLLF